MPTPSPGYRPPSCAPLTWSIWRDLIRPDVLTEFREVQHMLVEINRKLDEMGAREDAADARRDELIGLVRDHVNALQADNTALRAALVQADADKAAALEADSEADAASQEAANAALEELTGQAPPVEEPPADGGPVTEPAPDQPAPVDEPAPAGDEEDETASEG